MRAHGTTYSCVMSWRWGNENIPQERQSQKTGGHFADGEVVEVHVNSGSIIAVIDGTAYAMNGWEGCITRGLPEVNIIEGRSVAPYIKEALR